MSEKTYLRRNVFERLYNTPTMASRRQNASYDGKKEDDTKPRFNLNNRSPPRPKNLSTLFKSTESSQGNIPPRTKSTVITPSSARRAVTSSKQISKKRSPKSVTHFSSSQASPVIPSPPRKRNPNTMPKWNPTSATKSSSRPSPPRKQTPSGKPSPSATKPKKSASQPQLKPKKSAPRPSPPKDEDVPPSTNQTAPQPSPPKDEDVPPSTTQTAPQPSPLQDEDVCSDVPPQTTQTEANNAPFLSQENAKSLFLRLDVSGNGMLSLSEIDGGIDELNLSHKTVAMLTYQALDYNETGLISASQFPYFLNFLVYFNNLWDAFVCFDESDDLKISKDEYTPVAERLELFEDLDATFAELDKTGVGFILFEDFCALCAKRRLHEDNKGEAADSSIDKVPRSEEETVDPGPLEEMLHMLDSFQTPTEEKAKSLFQRLDIHGSGMLPLAEIDTGITEMTPRLGCTPLALKAYKTLGTNKNGMMDASEFHYCLLFLVYFNNMWDEFVFFDEDDLRVSKGEFTSVAERLHLFDDVGATFAEMDICDEGFILFEDFCALCARHKLELMRGDNLF
jgi:Ca2+-binding EF-hand superfamily protein